MLQDKTKAIHPGPVAPESNSPVLTIRDVLEMTGAKLVYGEEYLDKPVRKAFASDLMSDVLQVEANDFVLITGLAHPQVIRTAEMADIGFVLLVRNKKATPEMISLAKQAGIALAESKNSMYHTSGLLFKAGVRPVS